MMLFMTQGHQDLWARETPLTLPSSPSLLSGLSLQQVAGHARLPQEGWEVPSENKIERDECGGLSGLRYSKVWNQLAAMLHAFEVCLLLTIPAPSDIFINK